MFGCAQPWGASDDIGLVRWILQIITSLHCSRGILIPTMFMFKDPYKWVWLWGLNSGSSCPKRSHSSSSVRLRLWILGLPMQLSHKLLWLKKSTPHYLFGVGLSVLNSLVLEVFVVVVVVSRQQDATAHPPRREAGRPKLWWVLLPILPRSISQAHKHTTRYNHKHKIPPKYSTADNSAPINFSSTQVHTQTHTQTQAHCTQKNTSIQSQALLQPTLADQYRKQTINNGLKTLSTLLHSSPLV